jgi:hypothetical protein
VASPFDLRLVERTELTKPEDTHPRGHPSRTLAMSSP